MATAIYLKLVSNYTHSIQEAKQGFAFPATLRTLAFLRLFSFKTVLTFKSKTSLPDESNRFAENLQSELSP
jgi:hypothetical protein